MIHRFRTLLLLIASALIVSCSSEPKFNENDKIFHAAPGSGGIGSIYFALYEGNQYQICESGGLGETCYTGNFLLNGDTIILQNLDKRCYLKYNRLLICKYQTQDSTYWQWKYPKHSINWETMKDRDISLGNEGDVHQLDIQNKLIFDSTYYFVIAMDKTKRKH